MVDAKDEDKAKTIQTITSTLSGDATLRSKRELIEKFISSTIPSIDDGNKAAKEVGYIADPRFEVYGSEDIDLSWELGKLGYRCAALNDLYVHHFHHRSSRSSGLDLKECLRINNGKFIQKWYDEISSMLEDEAVRDNFMKNSE